MNSKKSTTKNTSSFEEVSTFFNKIHHNQQNSLNDRIKEYKKTISNFSKKKDKESIKIVSVLKKLVINYQKTLSNSKESQKLQYKSFQLFNEAAKFQNEYKKHLEKRALKSD